MCRTPPQNRLQLHRNTGRWWWFCRSKLLLVLHNSRNKWWCGAHQRIGVHHAILLATFYIHSETLSPLNPCDSVQISSIRARCLATLFKSSYLNTASDWPYSQVDNLESDLDPKFFEFRSLFLIQSAEKKTLLNSVYSRCCRVRCRTYRVNAECPPYPFSLPYEHVGHPQHLCHRRRQRSGLCNCFFGRTIMANHLSYDLLGSKLVASRFACGELKLP